MREDKYVKDYIPLIRKELKEKYNIDMPSAKIHKLLMFFFKRLDEAMKRHYFIYITKYMFFYFSSNRYLRKLIRTKKVLSPDERYQKYHSTRKHYSEECV